MSVRNRLPSEVNVPVTSRMLAVNTNFVSGLPVIFESARISSRLLLEDLGVDHQFQVGASQNALGTERAGAYETVG